MSEPMTEQEIKQIEERANKATPGPWEFVDMAYEIWAGNETVVGSTEDEGLAISCDNAEFIAHSRTDIDRMLAEVKRLQKELDAAKKDIQKWCTGEDQFQETVAQLDCAKSAVAEEKFKTAVANEQLRILKNDIHVALDLIKEESQRHKGKTENVDFHSGVIYAFGYAIGVLPTKIVNEWRGEKGE